MVWSFEAIPAAERTLFAADKPVLAVSSVPAVPTNFEWNASGAYGADASAAGYPARRMYDGMVEVWSKPSSAQTTWYVMMKFATAVTVDWFGFLGHTLGTIGSVVSSVEIADTDAFTAGAPSNMVEIWSATPASDDRFAAWSLKHTGSDPLRYAGVTRARFKMTKGAAFTPQFCELFLGRRYQLRYKPNEGWDDSRIKDISEIVEAQGGGGGEVIYSENQFVLDASWTMDDATDISDYKAYWKAAKRGFVWCPSPTSAPQAWNFMRRSETERVLPISNPSIREVTLTAVEQGPDQYYMENE